MRAGRFVRAVLFGAVKVAILAGVHPTVAMFTANKIMTAQLFVAQSLDGVQTRGPDGGYHAAHQAYGRQDQRGYD